MNEAYAAGKITAPHLKGWENMRLVRYVIFGWYAKTDSGIYGIIRVSWCYADDAAKKSTMMTSIISHKMGKVPAV